MQKDVLNVKQSFKMGAFPNKGLKIRWFGLTL